MDARAQLRARAVPELARLMRSRDFRGAAADSVGSGPQRIIVALADDRMGYVFDRLRDAGGTAVLAMPDGDGWELAYMWPASSARLAVANEDDDVSVVHEATEVSMFFDYLRHVRIVVVRCVTARLVDHGELQLTI